MRPGFTTPRPARQASPGRYGFPRPMSQTRIPPFHQWGWTHRDHARRPLTERRDGVLLKHDPEKCEAVFRKDHA